MTIIFAQISIDDPGDCQNNYLKLYDGPDSSSLPVGPYCGVVCYPGKTTSAIFPILRNIGKRILMKPVAKHNTFSVTKFGIVQVQK